MSRLFLIFVKSVFFLIVLQIRCREIQSELEAALKAQVRSDHEVEAARCERVAATKSRDWHRDQMKEAREARQTLQVWSLTLFYSVDFPKTRIVVNKCVFYKRTIKVCDSCC